MDGIPIFEAPLPAPLPADRVDLTVVMLAWNEAENLAVLLPEVRRTLDRLGITAEVLVVDGGSRDDSSAVAAGAGARLLVQKEPGFGRALQEGFAAARGRWIITMDSDLSHPVVFIEKLWEARAQGDLIVASRYVPGALFEAPWPRKVLSRILNGFFSRALSLPVRDVSSNFRLYNADVLAGVALEGVQFEVLEEVLIKVFMTGARLGEVPFHYAPRGEGASKARIFLFGLRLLRTFFKMWKLRSSIAAADYDHRAHDSRVPLQRWWQRRRTAVLHAWTRGVDGAVLDAGCGSGRLVSLLPRVVGMDIQLNKLRFLRDKAPALVQGSVFRLPFKDASFDGLVSSQVIEHLPAGERPFREMARVLKPGGTLVLGTPDYGRPWWPAIEWLYARVHPQGYADEHITHYTLPMLKELLDRYGFDFLEADWILGAELTVRARRRDS